MPINRIEEEIRERAFGAGLNKFGNIRKGLPPDEKGRMTDLTYFRTTFYPEYADLIPAFDQLYGSEPTSIQPVFVIGDTREQAFQYWLEEHTKTKLLHQCDGDLQHKHYEPNEGRAVESNLVCERKNGGTCGCRPVASFNVILPEFCRLVRKIGYFTVHTGSMYDIWALAGWFKDIETLHNGKVSGIPLILGRGPRNVPIRFKNDKGEYVRKIDTKHLIFLSPAAGFVEHVLMPGYTAAPYALANGETVDGEIVSVAPNTAQAKFEQSFNQLNALPENVPTPDEEMPDFVPARNWDWDKVANKTSDLFEHEIHQQNAFEKMIAEGELTDEMDTMAAIAAVLDNRRRRSMEKLNAEAESEKPWNADPKIVGEFVNACVKRFGMNMADIIAALSYASENPIENVSEYLGTKEGAWAACLALHCQYDPGRIEAMLPDPKNESLKLRALMLAEKAAEPF